MIDSPPAGTTFTDGANHCLKCDDIVTNWRGQRETSYAVPRMMITVLPCGHVSAVLLPG